MKKLWRIFAIVMVACVAAALAAVLIIAVAHASETGSVELERSATGDVRFADDGPVWVKTGVFATSDLKKYRKQVVQALDKPGTMVPAEWETKSQKRVDFLWLEKVKTCKAAVTYDKAASKVRLVPGCGGEVLDRTDVNIDTYMASLMIAVGLFLLALLFHIRDWDKFSLFLMTEVVVFISGLQVANAIYESAWYFISIVALSFFVSIWAFVSACVPYKVSKKWYKRMTFAYVVLAVVIGMMHVNGYGWQ